MKVLKRMRLAETFKRLLAWEEGLCCTWESMDYPYVLHASLWMDNRNSVFWVGTRSSRVLSRIPRERYGFFNSHWADSPITESVLERRRADELLHKLHGKENEPWKLKALKEIAEDLRKLARTWWANISD